MLNVLRVEGRLTEMEALDGSGFPRVPKSLGNTEGCCSRVVLPRGPRSKMVQFRVERMKGSP